MITVLGFNLLGDGLRDLLDPRGMTRRGEGATPAAGPDSSSGRAS
jgi:peptide/nickel transport system permease protein